MTDGTEQRRETRAEWLVRALMLVVGAAVALAGILHFNGQRIRAEDVALGTETVSYAARFDGRLIAAYRVEEFAGAYPPRRASPADPPEVLWLGNSQMHSVNQLQEGDRTAPAYASDALGYPARCLSLPNASLQEHLAIFLWAAERRAPETLILPLVYDDLREDDLRPEFEALAGDELIAALDSLPGETGPRLAGQLATAGDDTGAAIDASGSFQERSEAFLEARFSERLTLWAERPHTLAAVQLALYDVRNTIFGIDPTSERKMIPIRYSRNMAALDALLQAARARGVDVLAYVVPLRWDHEPPYDLAAYRAWKARAREMVEARGARFRDLDTLVPDEQWGTFGRDGAIDFMHFQDAGHRRLGAEIATWLRETER